MEFIALIIPAFIAGLLTFFAPCTLPLAPAYLGFISGVSLNDLDKKEQKNKIRKKIFLNGLFFVFGFTFVFVLLGSLVGLVGGMLAPFRVWITRIGGVFVIIFGLSMVGLFELSFFKQKRKIKIPAVLEKGKLTTSFILGSVFAFGWTPCVGPILGSILFLASTSGTIGQGAFLLLIFSIGLAIPFLVLAFGIGSATKYISKLSKYLNYISVVGGIFLILLGILLLTNNFTLLIIYGFKIFGFLNYEEALLKYL